MECVVWVWGFCVCRAFVEFSCSFSRNQISDASMHVVEEYCQRNVIFADMKPRILAFRLASQFGKVHVPAEIWHVLSFEFVLPL
jgi:hypothetical protein